MYSWSVVRGRDCCRDTSHLPFASPVRRTEQPRYMCSENLEFFFFNNIKMANPSNRLNWDITMAGLEHSLLAASVQIHNPFIDNSNASASQNASSQESLDSGTDIENQVEQLQSRFDRLRQMDVNRIDIFRRTHDEIDSTKRVRGMTVSVLSPMLFSLNKHRKYCKELQKSTPAV